MTRRLVAELFGTFMLVFFGAGAVMTTNYPKADFGLLGIALAHGLAFAIGISATMAISGGHLNPAITAGMLAIKRIDAKSAALYIAAQLLGAILAAMTIRSVLPGGVTKVLALGTPAIAATITLGQAITIEAILTFFLMSAFLATTVSAERPKIAGFGVGLMLFVVMIFGGPLTGAAVNPARCKGAPGSVNSQRWAAMDMGASPARGRSCGAPRVPGSG